MKIVLFGGTGQLGFEFARQFNSNAETRCISICRSQIDLSDDPNRVRDFLERLVQVETPDLIVNAAAYTSVDLAEKERGRAFQINAWFPGELARLSRGAGAKLLHFSTDYVFDGELSGRAYTESDTCNPLSTYGSSKLEGELAVLSADPRALIVRTSWVVGEVGQNFAKRILQLACERPELRIVADQWGVPSPTRFLVSTLLGVDHNTLTEDLHGIYHLCPHGATNWYEYACWVLKAAWMHPHWRDRIKLESLEAVKPIRSDEFVTQARRPKNSRLDCRRWFEKFPAIERLTWEEAMRPTLNDLLSSDEHP